MRTKTLLLTAALGIAGLTSTMAQVYSVNAVGYVNLTLAPGYTLIANPLNAATNKLNSILASAAIEDGSQVFFWDKATQRYSPTVPTFFNPPVIWDVDTVVAPGTGFFFYNPKASAVTVTFVGDVMQGSLSNNVSAGYQIVASQVPQAGKVTTDLGLPGYDGNQIFTWNSTTQRYDPTVPTFVQTGATPDIGAWDPAEPTVGVGQSFFYFANAATKQWTRTFNVNN